MKYTYQIIAEIGGYPVLVATERTTRKAVAVLVKHAEIHQNGINEGQIKVYLTVDINEEEHS